LKSHQRPYHSGAPQKLRQTQDAATLKHVHFNGGQYLVRVTDPRDLRDIIGKGELVVLWIAARGLPSRWLTAWSPVSPDLDERYAIELFANDTRRMICRPQARCRSGLTASGRGRERRRPIAKGGVRPIPASWA